MISVIAMGPGESGKSAMLNKFVEGVFPHHFRKSFEEEITDAARTHDLHLWFVSPFIIGLFFFSFYNAFAWSNCDGSNDEESIATMEIEGSVVLWEFAWFMISFYMALDIEMFPEVSSLQESRPFVLHLGDDESIDYAYVFLRGLAKSTLQMLRVAATPGRIIIAASIAFVYALVPRLAHIVDDTHCFVANTNDETESINALVTNIVLCLQNYVEWIDDVTSLLDESFAESFAESRDLPYLYTQRSMLSLCLCLCDIAR